MALEERLARARAGAKAMSRSLEDPRCLDVLASFDRQVELGRVAEVLAVFDQQFDLGATAESLAAGVVLSSDGPTIDGWPVDGMRIVLAAFLEHAPEQALDEMVAIASSWSN
jgi:hypothetical protein